MKDWGWSAVMSDILMDYIKRPELDILAMEVEEIFFELTKYYKRKEAEEAEYDKMMKDMRDKPKN